MWYFTKMVVILFLFLGSSYSTVSSLSLNAGDAQLETPLSQDAERLADVYRQALVGNQQALAPQVALSSGEIVLLLRPDGTILDRRGRLTDEAVEQLQSRVESSAPTMNMTLPLSDADSRQTTQDEYRVLIKPVLDKNTRIAILMVGLERISQIPPGFWLIRVMVVLLIAVIGGYLLARTAMSPVQMIARMAQEINATDLRRRLNWKRRDEFGQLAATFDQMLARLDAAFKRQTQFTADASHELRTPLSIINLAIHRALTQFQTPEEYRQALEQIQAENEQMATIVNSLLLLARADTGQMELHRETVDLSDISLACVERLLSLAQEKQVSVSTGELPELLVSGDPQHLSRMVTNMLENAIKYTSGIGQRVHVDLACEQGRWAVLRVQDDGPGIAQEHLPYLFERFYRADKARTRQASEQAGDESRETPGGTGLGLAIVLWIVQSHGGEVRVESKIGAGSLFELRLPLLKERTSRPLTD